MKGVRFYLEFPDLKTKRNSGKEHKGHSGNVTAVFIDTGHFSPYPHYSYDCAGGFYFEKNSPVCGMSCCDEWLREETKRISEKLAREIHPRLFAYLDN